MLISRSQVEQHDADAQRFVPRNPSPRGSASRKPCRASHENRFPRTSRQDRRPRKDARLDAGRSSRRAAVRSAAFVRRCCEKSCAAFAGALVRLRRLLVTDAFRIAGGGGLDVDAMQHLMEEHAVSCRPTPAQAGEWRRVQQLLDRDDTGAVQPLLHARSQCRRSPPIRGRAEFRAGRPSVMITSPSGFADRTRPCKNRESDADRAGEAFADLIAQRSFNLERKLARGRRLPFGAGKPFRRSSRLSRPADRCRPPSGCARDNRCRAGRRLHRGRGGTAGARRARECSS